MLLKSISFSVFALLATITYGQADESLVENQSSAPQVSFPQPVVSKQKLVRAIERSLRDSTSTEVDSYRFQLAERFFQEKDNVKALEQALFITERGKKVGSDSYIEAETYYFMGKLFVRMSAYDQAEEMFDRSYEIFNDRDDFFGKIKSIQAKGVNFYDAGAYEKAGNTFRSLIYDSQLYRKNNAILHEIYIGLLKSYLALDNFNEGLKYAQQFDQLVDEGISESSEISDLAGQLYLEMGLYESALTSFEQGLLQTPGNYQMQARYGFAHLSLNQLDAAKTNLEIALAAAQATKNEQSLIHIFNVLAQLHTNLGQLDQTLFYLKGAQQLGLKYQQYTELEQTYQQFQGYYQARNDRYSRDQYGDLELALPNLIKVKNNIKERELVKIKNLIEPLLDRYTLLIGERLSAAPMESEVTIRDEEIRRLSERLKELLPKENDFSNRLEIKTEVLSAAENQQELELSRKEKTILQQQAALQQAQLEAAQQRQQILIVSIGLSALVSFGLILLTLRTRKSKKTIAEQNMAMEKQQRYLKHAQLELKKTLRIAQHSSQKLRKSNHQLKSMQSQLIHSEKMSSLGQLTAGIVHEINNPVNFVKGGIEIVEKNLSVLLELFKELEAAEQDPKSATRSVDEIKKEVSEELKYNYEVLPQMMKDVLVGASRISEIVNGLRIFSRQGETNSQFVSLHEVIDSALLILKNKYLPVAEVKLVYDDSIDEIECYPGLLNQVIVNLVNNAIDAIDKKGKITIKTEGGVDSVRISVSDTGNGIEEEHIAHIFEPFFTTKEVGEGTGIGLAISYSIVSEHGGSIKVKSKVGKGTTFMIELPRKLEKSELNEREILENVVHGE
ncbi:MAG: signal transduction histidine kinase [Cyclobacteriaceae bacterium]|jgi:signal transduction histidine kinase